MILTIELCSIDFELLLLFLSYYGKCALILWMVRQDPSRDMHFAMGKGISLWVLEFDTELEEK